MIVLSIRTDKPEAEIGLYDDGKQLTYQTWEAHRRLAETIHGNIQQLLHEQGKDWKDIQGIIGYLGPGSFTGLRIGLSVANALAYSLDAPIVGQMGETWIEDGCQRLAAAANDIQILPEYGMDPHITQARK